MTLVGHSLTGAAIGVTILPPRASRLRTFVHLAVFVLLANAPDLPVGEWGHGLYFYSHSIFSNLLFILLAGLLVTFSTRFFRRIGGWPVLIGGGIAWLSHLLLDAFYKNAKGYGAFWPFSTAHIALPIPWFSVMYGGLFPLTAEKLHILLIEAASYLPLLILAILIRRLASPRSDGIPKNKAPDPHTGH
jgi:hypothetical protein